MGTWLRRYRCDGRPALALVCLPHAGGTASMFSSWHPLLPPDIALIGVQYPGRHDRMTEPYVEDVPDAADRVVAELGDLRDRPLALFGHSAGSAVAYEIAVRLEQDPGFTLRHLFVSGRMAPHRAPGESHDRLSDEELAAVVRRFGGRGVEALEVPDLWPVILPPLRADLRMTSGYRPAGVQALRAPVTAFGGDTDHTCSPAALDTWRDATTGRLDRQVFRGGHHYLTECPERVVDAIVRRLRAEGPGGAVSSESSGPSASLDRQIAGLWREHLDGCEVDVNDDFFALGGNSLIGMRIIARIAEDYGVELSVRAFYLAQTPARVAELIEKERVGS